MGSVHVLDTPRVTQMLNWLGVASDNFDHLPPRALHL